MATVFSYKKNVLLKDLTIYGNVYFAHYIEWQGEAREALLSDICPSPTFLRELKLVTVSAGVRFKGEAVYGDQVLIEVIPTKINLTTIELEFIYRKQSQVIAEGRQRIGFTDLSGKVVPLPSDLLSNGKKYLKPELLSQILIIEKKIQWITQHSNLI